MIDINEYFKKVNYYIATSDEMIGIDANYDYLNDNFSHENKQERVNVTYYDLIDDKYMDGVLTSKALVTGRQVETYTSLGGLRKYFNIPKSYYLMGDCGAPTYFNEDNPPFTISDLLDFYENLDLDFGITLDHIVDMVDMTNRIKPTKTHIYRRELSCKNAIEMLKLVKERKSKIYLLGSVQGWSPESYKQSLIELGEAGFKYCAIGGLTMTGNTDIVSQILSYLTPTAKKYGIKLHLLGFGRLALLSSFLKYDILSSIDNSTPLLNASNAPTSAYFFNLKNKFYKYDTIYLPIFSKGAPSLNKKIKNLYENDYSDIIVELDEFSHNIVKQLREFDELENSKEIKNKELFNSILRNIQKFELMHRKYSGTNHDGMNTYLNEIKLVLNSKCWKNCSCPLCKTYGINMVTFRSQMRNKLRGIHNLKHYYDYFCCELNKNNKMNKFLL